MEYTVKVLRLQNGKPVYPGKRSFFVPNDKAAHTAFVEMWTQSPDLIRAEVSCAGRIVCGGWR